MKTLVVTGGAGFFGGILKRQILERQDRCISIDICPDEDNHPNLVKLQMDLRDADAVKRVFASERIDGVIHCAAVLAHGTVKREDCSAAMSKATRNVAEAMRANKIGQLVFTSTNCLWGEGFKTARPRRRCSQTDRTIWTI